MLMKLLLFFILLDFQYKSLPFAGTLNSFLLLCSSVPPFGITICLVTRSPHHLPSLALAPMVFLTLCDIRFQTADSAPASWSCHAYCQAYFPTKAFIIILDADLCHFLLFMTSLIFLVLKYLMLVSECIIL